MKHTIRLVIAAIIAMTAIQSASAQTYDLRLNLKKGQKYNQTMIMDMVMNESVAGNDVNMAMKIQFGFVQEVKSVDEDGNYNLESAYSRVAMDMNVAGTNLTYDSDKKPAPSDSAAQILGKTFNSIIGKKYTLVLSPTGKVIRITGMKEILAELSKDASPTVAQLLTNTFDEKNMISNYSSSYDFFPDHAVKKGETWRRTTKLESVFPMTVESSYTLREVKGTVAIIDVSADIVMKKDDIEMQGMTVKVDLKGSYKGTYNLDVPTGLCSTGHLDMPIKGTMDMMGMTVPLDVTSKIDIKTSSPK